MAPEPEKTSSSNVRVLVVGGTGYLGRRLVEASLAEGHATLVLQRPEIGIDIEKLQMLLAFKARGATLVEASLSDHDALVKAVRRADVVISAVSGVHFRSHHILAQLNLVRAIKEAGNVKRFVPSEFGIDPSRMADALEPGKVTFDDKMAVRKAIEEAGIPYTYVSAGCFAGYFVGGLCQPGRLTPSRDAVQLFEDGSVKAVFADEDDIARYTINAISDPRTINKSLYVRPAENVLSQLEVVRMWEKLTQKELKKISVSREEFLDTIKGLDFAQQVGLGHYFHVFYDGCLTNFKIDRDMEEASKLYPEFQYKRAYDYLKRYL